MWQGKRKHFWEDTGVEDNPVCMRNRKLCDAKHDAPEAGPAGRCPGGPGARTRPPLLPAFRMLCENHRKGRSKAEAARPAQGR